MMSQDSYLITEKGETHWLIVDRQECCGRIFPIESASVPAGFHQAFGLPRHLTLYLTSNGQWAPTPELAKEIFLSEPVPEAFIITGRLLPLFISGEFIFEGFGRLNLDAYYRVFRTHYRHDNRISWDAEILKSPTTLETAADPEPPLEFEPLPLP
jgi:hypothetical protein